MAQLLTEIEHWAVMRQWAIMGKKSGSPVCVRGRLGEFVVSLRSVCEAGWVNSSVCGAGWVNSS